MTQHEQKIHDLVGLLPRVRGRYRPCSNLGKVTWFRVGGDAEVLFKPADIEDLCFFLSQCPSEITVFPLGVGSNVIIRDGGVPGVTVRLGQGFQNIHYDRGYLDIGAGILDKNLALLSAREGWGNLEFLCGVPGTIGGALRMNAGCYGSEVKDVLEYALVVDRQGRSHKLGVDDLGLGYRSCRLPKDYIFVGARFKVLARDPHLVKSTIDTFLLQREKSQPIRERTGGSTFANPDQERKAWKLIDEAGCRGLVRGGAQVSKKHCNFLINTGAATAEDLESLGEEVRRQVMNKFQIDLRWEIQRVGVKTMKNSLRAA